MGSNPALPPVSCYQRLFLDSNEEIWTFKANWIKPEREDEKKTHFEEIFDWKWKSEELKSCKPSYQPSS